MSHRLIAFAAAALALQGCATAPTPPGATVDYNIGIAKSCTFTAPDLSASSTGNGTITMTNDGFCAVRVKEKDGQPYQLGLLRQRPEHGRVFVQKLGGETRLEYSADDRFTGTDRFSVALRSRTSGVPDAVVQVAVTVSMGEGIAAPAPAAAAAPATTRPRTSTPTTRPTTRSTARPASGR